MRIIAATLLSVGLAGCATGIPVSFWPTDLTPPSGVEIDEHPCGQVLTIRTNVVPRDKGWLEAELIREIDEFGKVLRSWRVPIDHYPVGVDGDMVLLAFGSKPQSVMTVDMDGRIEIRHSIPGRHLESRECPSPYDKDFYCSVISTDPVRMLVSSPVCT